MFGVDKPENNSTITDYNGKYPKYIDKYTEKGIRGWKEKLHPKTSISLTMPFPYNVNYVRRAYKHYKKTTFTYVLAYIYGVSHTYKYARDTNSFPYMYADGSNTFLCYYRQFISGFSDIVRSP